MTIFSFLVDSLVFVIRCEAPLHLNFELCGFDPGAEGPSCECGGRGPVRLVCLDLPALLLWAERLELPSHFVLMDYLPMAGLQAAPHKEPAGGSCCSSEEVQPLVGTWHT